MGLPSPYYNESHKKWQKTCRALVDELLMPEGGEWERAGDVPESLYQKFVAANFLIPNLSAPLPVKWLHKLGITHLPGGLPVEDFDYLHTLMYVFLPELLSCPSHIPKRRTPETPTHISQIR